MGKNPNATAALSTGTRISKTTKTAYADTFRKRLKKADFMLCEHDIEIYAGRLGIAQTKKCLCDMGYQMEKIWVNTDKINGKGGV